MDDFISPFYADAIIWLSYIFIILALVSTLLSVARSLRHRGGKARVLGGIPVTRIALAVVSVLVLCLIITFWTGSSEPITVNGEEFSDTFWLRAADMFIVTSAFMAGVAIVAVIFGVSGLNRRLGRRGGAL